MKEQKTLRSMVGANLMLLMTFIFLPALLVNPDVDVFQNAMRYLTNE